MADCAGVGAGVGKVAIVGGPEDAGALTIPVGISATVDIADVGIADVGIADVGITSGIVRGMAIVLGESEAGTATVLLATARGGGGGIGGTRGGGGGATGGRCESVIRGFSVESVGRVGQKNWAANAAAGAQG